MLTKGYLTDTHQMSEVCHHTSILALCHVQGLAACAQNIEAPVPKSKGGWVR